MLAIIAEIFTHRAAGERRDILHRRRVGRRSSNDDGILQCATLFEDARKLRYSRTLLTDRDIDAIELVFLIARFVDRLLVQDRIENDRRLPGLTVSDDQLALATADRDQRVNS